MMRRGPASPEKSTRRRSNRSASFFPAVTARRAAGGWSATDPLLLPVRQPNTSTAFGTMCASERASVFCRRSNSAAVWNCWRSGTPLAAGTGCFRPRLQSGEDTPSRSSPVEHIKQPEGEQTEDGEYNANVGVAHPPLLFHPWIGPSGRVREIQKPQRNSIQAICNADFAPELVEAVIGFSEFLNRDDKFRPGRQGGRWTDADASRVDWLGTRQVSHQSWHTKTPSGSRWPEANIGHRHPNFNGAASSPPHAATFSGTAGVPDPRGPAARSRTRDRDEMMSTGRGNTMVVFFSVPISTSV